MSVGAVTAAALYFHRLFNPVNIVLMEFDQIQTASAGLARLAGVLEIEPVPEPPAGRAPSDASLELVDVEHAYDGPRVLDTVSLRLEPGERVALVGASGAGKTTLAAIAAGVLKPTAGVVKLGGVDLRALGEDHTRERVALVSQEVHVFSGPWSRMCGLPGRMRPMRRSSLRWNGSARWHGCVRYRTAWTPSSVRAVTS